MYVNGQVDKVHILQAIHGYVGRGEDNDRTNITQVASMLLLLLGWRL